MTNHDPEWRQHWPEFAKVMRARLEQGHIDYGDESFDRNPPNLLAEIEEEALDIIGWSFILWVRLRHLRETAAKMEETS